MKIIDLSKPMTQADFGDLIGMSQQAVSEFVRTAGLPGGVPAGSMLVAYCERLREVAAGRTSSATDGLDLTQERAALARSQRIAQEIKNGQAWQMYAPTSLLAEVLAFASQSVVEQFDRLPAALREASPDLPEQGWAVVMNCIAGARIEWVARTMQLLPEQLGASPEEDDGNEDTEGGRDGTY